jgi:hypothetical protein
LPDSFRFAPGRGSSLSAAFKLPSTKRRFVRYDCEYRRNGTSDLFVFVDFHRPWRKVKVTESRTAVDFQAL